MKKTTDIFHATELLLLTLVRNDRNVAGRVFEIPGASAALRWDERSRLQLIGVCSTCF